MIYVRYSGRGLFGNDMLNATMRMRETGGASGQSKERPIPNQLLLCRVSRQFPGHMLCEKGL